MATNDYKSLRELTDRQRTAIDALVAGATQTEAADRAGVHRVTVSNWAKRHPGFQAELNRRRRELGEQRAARLRELDAAALDAVGGQLEAGDPEFAMKWLRFRGLNATVFPDTGPTDPEEIIERLVAARAAMGDSGLGVLLDSLNGVDRSQIRADVEAELTADLATTEDV